MILKWEYIPYIINLACVVVLITGTFPFIDYRFNKLLCTKLVDFDEDGKEEVLRSDLCHVTAEHNVFVAAIAPAMFNSIKKESALKAHLEEAESYGVSGQEVLSFICAIFIFVNLYKEFRQFLYLRWNYLNLSNMVDIVT